MSGPLRLRVVSYNIHGGRPAAGPVDLEAISRVLRGLNPDVAAIQEVSRYFPPNAWLTDQPGRLRELLGMDSCFRPALGLGPLGYGNAVLARGRHEACRRIPLPWDGPWRLTEPRAAVEVRLDHHGRSVRVLCTHLSLSPSERMRQAKHVAKALRDASEPVVLMGDLNAAPGSDEIREFTAAGFADCAGPDVRTFPSGAPSARLDYILASPHFQVERCWAEPSLASDHLPLAAELVLTA